MDPLERAATDLRERNYGSAIRTLELLTARDPANADALRYLTQAYHRAGDQGKAAEAAERYVALRPTDAAGHHNLGVLLAQLGQREAAERAFQAALSADPAHAKARRALHELTSGETQPAAEPPRPASPASPPSPEGNVGRWVARIAAGLTVLASAAILLWLFLPGGPANPGRPTQAPEPTPHAVTTPPPVDPTATEPRVTQAPQPTPQVNPDPQPATETPAPDPQDNATKPLPSPQRPSQAVPDARNLWRRVWRTRRQVYWYPQQWPTPGPMSQMQQPQAASGMAQGTGSPAEGGATGQGETTKPQPVPQAPAPKPQPRPAQPQPQPKPQPKPRTEPQPRQAPAPAPQPLPLFSPQEAQRVVEAMDAAEREGIQAELGYLANWLRNDPACNDREFWPILQAALATTGPAMMPQGLSIGAGEVMAVITNADTNYRAADRLEFHSRNLRSVLPQPVKVQIAQVLAQSTSARYAYNTVDSVLRQSNVATSQQTANVLLEALLRAERAAAQRQAEQTRQR